MLFVNVPSGGELALYWLEGFFTFWCFVWDPTNYGGILSGYDLPDCYTAGGMNFQLVIFEFS